MERVFDRRAMHLLSVFHTITSFFPKDCIESDSTVYFILPKDKKLSYEQILALSKLLSKRIQILPYFENYEDFLKYFLSPKIKLEKQNNGSLLVRLNKFNYLKYKKNKELIDTLMERLYGIDKLIVKSII